MPGINQVGFSTIADRRQRGPVDSNLVLRSYGAAALSATGSSTGVEFDSKAVLGYKVCLSTAAYTSYTASSAEWSIRVEVSDTLGGTYTPVGRAVVPPGTALETEILISPVDATTANSDPNFVRVTATRTGTPGNLTYGAWIVPIYC